MTQTPSSPALAGPKCLGNFVDEVCFHQRSDPTTLCDNCKDLASERDPPVMADCAPGEPVAWRFPIRTIADLVSNLLNLDQSKQIYGAYHLEAPVPDPCRTRSLSLSWEHVANGRIKPDESVPYSLVIWTADERAAPQPSPRLDREGIARAVESVIGQICGDAHAISRLVSVEVADAILAGASSTERAVEIPDGVYFSAESSNFYHVETKRGCGNDFYRIWKDHWRAFPQSEAAAVSSNQHSGGK